MDNFIVTLHDDADLDVVADRIRAAHEGAKINPLRTIRVLIVRGPSRELLSSIEGVSIVGKDCEVRAAY